jgi:hypothetical protein
MIDGTSGSGADFNLLVRWIDQTHKDLLHTGIYRHVLRQKTAITSVAATRSYVLTPTDVRRVEVVYNQKLEMLLSPITEAFGPSSLADPADIDGGARPDRLVATHRVSTHYPQFYWLDTTVTGGTPAHTLYLFPPPATAQFAGTVDVYYIQQAATVSAAGDTLAAGEDSRDAMIAGVLSRAYRYLGWIEMATYWGGVYEAMKVGETNL